MSYRAVSSFVALSLLAVACGSSSEDVSSNAQDVSTAWLDTYLPAGSPAEAKVLALANDSTMTSGKFVSECGISQQAADAIVSYRQGDDATIASDNQRFDSAKELDALPFTDDAFWNATMRCAVSHVAGAPVCVPGHAPVILELVVDESGSMSGDKWTALSSAVGALYNDLHQAADKDTYVGMVMFDDAVNRHIVPAPMTTDAHFDDLRSAITKPQPHGGGTSTLKALQAAYQEVSSVPASTQSGARRIVVLLSDGSPTGGDTEKAQVVQIVSDQYAAAAPTVLYAVGIGPFPTDNVAGYDPHFMGQLALVGGTAPAGCVVDATDIANVCHVQLTPGGGVTVLGADLRAALTKIRNSAGSTDCP